MNIVILSSVRLIGDGIAPCLNGNADLIVTANVSQFSMLRDVLYTAKADFIAFLYFRCLFKNKQPKARVSVVANAIPAYILNQQDLIRVLPWT